MSNESRIREWLDAHGAMVDELRSAEIRMAIAIDAVRRAAPARHADTHDLLQDVIAAAGPLAELTTSALRLPKVPDVHGEIFFRAACQRWLDVAEPLTTADGTSEATDFDQAAQELVTGRNELLRAMEALTRGTGRAAGPSSV